MDTIETGFMRGFLSMTGWVASTINSGVIGQNAHFCDFSTLRAGWSDCEKSIELPFGNTEEKKISSPLEKIGFGGAYAITGPVDPRSISRTGMSSFVGSAASGL